MFSKIENNSIILNELLQSLIEAYKQIVQTRTEMYIATYTFHIILYQIWNIYIPNEKKKLLRPTSYEWIYVIQDILDCDKHILAKANRNMKFIHQHSLSLYSKLWMKSEQTCRFDTMKKGNICMDKWDEYVNNRQQNNDKNINSFETWLDQYESKIYSTSSIDTIVVTDGTPPTSSCTNLYQSCISDNEDDKTDDEMHNKQQSQIPTTTAASINKIITTKQHTSVSAHHVRVTRSHNPPLNISHSTATPSTVANTSHLLSCKLPTGISSKPSTIKTLNKCSTPIRTRTHNYSKLTSKRRLQFEDNTDNGIQKKQKQSITEPFSLPPSTEYFTSGNNQST
jgi:hypothetical protein